MRISAYTYLRTFARSLVQSDDGENAYEVVGKAIDRVERKSEREKEKIGW